MIYVCPQCDGEDISEAGGHLLCAGCSYAFPADIHNRVAARLASAHNIHHFKVKERRRVGRPNKGAA